MNGIQSEDHRIGTYENNKISLPCSNDKIYFQNNGYYGLANYEKTVVLITI